MIAPRGAARRRAVSGAAARAALAMLVALAVAGCAARAPLRPAGTPQPDATGLARLAEATPHCAGLRTLTATLRLSGRTGTARLRGTVLAGLAAPAAIRLEGVAPFGPPVFLLAGYDDRATLLFPRAGEVLPDTPVPALLDALAGLDLGAAALRRLLAGCPDGVPGAATRFPGGWLAIAHGTGTRVLLREQTGAWRVVAIDQGPWQADYAGSVGGLPREIRLRGTGPGGVTDLRVVMEDPSMNVPVPEAAFATAVPDHARRISLEALRASAALRPDRSR